MSGDFVVFPFEVNYAPYFRQANSFLFPTCAYPVTQAFISISIHHFPNVSSLFLSTAFFLKLSVIPYLELITPFCELFHFCFSVFCVCSGLDVA